MALARTPYLRVLHRRLLVAGCEREPVMCLCLLAAVFIMCMSLTTVTLGTAILVVGLPFLRVLAKRDPQGFNVLRRSMRYRGHYVPRARVLQLERR